MDLKNIVNKSFETIKNKGKKLTITAAALAMLTMPSMSYGFKMHKGDADPIHQESTENENESVTKSKLTEIFNLAGAPYKGEILDITRKGKTIMTLEKDGVVNILDEEMWGKSTLPPEASSSVGISILKRKCKNTDLYDGDLLVLDDLGQVTVFEEEDDMLTNMGTYQTGIPNATGLATLFQKGECLFGVLKDDMLYAIDPNTSNVTGSLDLSGPYMTKDGIEVILGPKEGVEATKRNKLLMNTSDAVYNIKKKNGLFTIKDSATLQDNVSLPGLNDPCDLNNDLCVAPYTCQFDPDPFAVDPYTCQP